MKIKVLASDDFRKKAKPLFKKYISLKNELSELREQLEINPELGISLGNGLYKIKVGVKSKGKGKSGGVRVITYFVSKLQVVENEEFKVVHLATIYDKSEYDTITDKGQKNLIKEIDEEFGYDLVE
jgi:mRNA-degrading endonuclease RelE of RelBE toxin-antitoxin system